MAEGSGFYHGAYNFILRSFGLEIVSFLSRKSSGNSEFKRGRLGFYENGLFSAGVPRIWFHAASVGEATGAVPTLLALKKKLPLNTLFIVSGGISFPKRLTKSRSIEPSWFPHRLVTL